jgi:hypothetical protein
MPSCLGSDVAGVVFRGRDLPRIAGQIGKRFCQQVDPRGKAIQGMFTRWVARAIGLLGLFAFWVGMLVAAHQYPSEYDWRYMTMSSLVYPDRNPAGHLWASGGIVLCGLSGLFWTSILARRGDQRGAARSSIGISALRLGFFSMAWCALLPERLFTVSKGHEFLALTAFLSLCVGMVYQTFQTVERQLVRHSGGSTDAARLYAGLAAAAPLSPILLAGLAQAYVSRALPELPWVGLAWRALSVPLYLSFAFWEWIACAVFSAAIATFSLTTRES